jgi:hypothetical protein
MSDTPIPSQTIPTSLAPFFQEYDLWHLHIEREANPIGENMACPNRTIPFGN